jgi:hypothetical protein
VSNNFVEPRFLAYSAGIYLGLGVAVFGALRPGHRHVRHLIDRLGETGGANSGWFNYAVFLPIGLVCAWLAYNLPTDRVPAARWLAIFLAVGYLGSAWLACDLGAPIFSHSDTANATSWRNETHWLIRAVQYFGGAAVLFCAGFGQLGFCVAFAAAILLIPNAREWSGLVQRIAELILFLSFCRLVESA